MSIDTVLGIVDTSELLAKLDGESETGFCSKPVNETVPVAVLAELQADHYDDHEIAACWPLLSGADAEELAKSIKAQGLLQPITLFEGKILDGRNRYRACVAAGVEPRVIEYTGADPIGYCEAANNARRHLNESQRAMVAARLATLSWGNRPDAPRGASGVTQTDAADLMQVGRRQVQRARVVQERAAPELARAVDDGRLPVKTAARLADEPIEVQQAIAAKLDAGLEAPAAIRETRRENLREHLESVEVREAKAIDGVYDVVVIDPPWPMDRIERDERPNQVEMPYPVMSLEQIAALEIPAADDAHVFVWTTQKFLPATFEMLAKWRLNYVVTFVWAKEGGPQPFDLPQYNCEFAVYARRGTPKFLDTKAFRTCFAAKRGGHSEKPEEFYDVLRRVTAGRRIDMFNRRVIDGFIGWGKEAA